MYRLGIAELNGELGLSKSPKEGVQWLKRSAEHATAEFPHALHELALLHERGIDNVVFVDYEYSTELLAQAAELGYAPSAYRLGECYEYGKMGCPQDPALSIHYYVCIFFFFFFFSPHPYSSSLQNIAAQQNHRDACFALTAWYLVGSPGVLPQSDTEAFLWAQKAAEAGLAKAMYACGYFLEVGIGTQVNTQECALSSLCSEQ
jgi:TPR repeat protein